MAPKVDPAKTSTKNSYQLQTIEGAALMLTQSYAMRAPAFIILIKANTALLLTQLSVTIGTVDKET